MFLKSEHLSFTSSYFLILDSIVQKYAGGSGGEARPGRTARSRPGTAAAQSTGSFGLSCSSSEHLERVGIPRGQINSIRGHPTQEAFYLHLTSYAGAKGSGTLLALVEAGMYVGQV